MTLVRSCLATKGETFNPEKEIPHLSDKVILVTGGYAGLGKATVQALVKHSPSHVYIAGRNTEKGAEMIDEIKTSTPNAAISFLQCDLASFVSVEGAARQFQLSSQRLDILICNAGVMCLPPGLTQDGYEMQFGTNHLGHALLIKLLLPTLLRTAQELQADVRIITLASSRFRHTPPGGIVFKDLRNTQAHLRFGSWSRYGQSKLANVLYTKELARRYPGILSVSLHPGVVDTQLATTWTRGSSFLQAGQWMLRKTVLKSPEDGALNQLWAAFGRREKLVNGAYYEPIGVEGKQTKDSTNAKLAEELWEWTQAELAKYEACDV
ncbi:MAG: hypothetical protein MMC33_006645 [Icmadophila ericetorum]|nr:hypothetical protein [Icmadophila ericetorum]